MNPIRLHPPQGPRRPHAYHGFRCYCCGHVVGVAELSPHTSHADVCTDCDDFARDAGVSPIDLRVLIRPRP